MANLLWEMNPSLGFLQNKDCDSSSSKIHSEFTIGAAIQQIIILPITKNKFSSAHAHEVPFRYKAPPWEPFL